MIKFEHTEVVGWEAAIRGMRNPLNSWEKSDSYFNRDPDYECTDACPCLDFGDPIANCGLEIGPNDLDLMKKLRNAGTDHRKFMRMITVYVDIIAPLYWWKEFDTYKVGTVSNSCSTMHKIADKMFVPGDFSYEEMADFAQRSTINVIIRSLNRIRDRYLDYNSRGPELREQAKQAWYQMIQLLPTSYNQKRTVMLNYEVLANIYESRKNHKLDEWADHDLKTGKESIGNPKQYYFGFCDWIKTLPYSELITGAETSNSAH